MSWFLQGYRGSWLVEHNVTVVDEPKEIDRNSIDFSAYRRRPLKILSISLRFVDVRHIALNQSAASMTL